MSTNTVVRAVTIPVGSPVGRSWEELNAVLKGCFRLSTHAANWCVQQLYRRDTVGEAKTPDAVKQGRADAGRFYAYGDAAREPWFGEWAGAKQSLNIVLQYAHRKYLAERFDVLVRCKQGLLTVRFPYPFPVDADAWRTGYTAEGDWWHPPLLLPQPSGSTFPTVSLTLPGGEAFTLRLKRGPEFARQLAMFRQLHAAEELAGLERRRAALAKRSRSAELLDVERAIAHHRANNTYANKGEAVLYRNSKGDLLLKLVGHFPRRERQTEKTHAMLLRTDPAALLVAEIDGRAPWLLNGDHLKRWQAAHRAYLQRTGEELKREKRMDPKQRAGLNGSRELRCEKHRHRIGTAVHQITAQVARFCERQRVGVVVFDDHDRRFLPDGFAWHMLGERLAYKLDEIGVQLVSRDSVAPEEFDAWSADRSLVRATALAGRRLVAGVNRTGPHPAVTPTSTGSTSRPRRSRAASARP